jgi:hypothetical protein
MSAHPLFLIWCEALKGQTLVGMPVMPESARSAVIGVDLAGTASASPEWLAYRLVDQAVHVFAPAVLEEVDRSDLALRVQRLARIRTTRDVWPALELSEELSEVGGASKRTFGMTCAFSAAGALAMKNWDFAAMSAGSSATLLVGMAVEREAGLEVVLEAHRSLAAEARAWSG